MSSVTGSSPFRVTARLWGLMAPFRWALPVIVAIGLLTSLAEGVGIGLFIPLLESLSGAAPEPGAASPVVERLRGLFQTLPPERRLYVLSALIFASICGKSVLSFANAALLGWLDARLGHRIRTGLHDQLLEVSYGYLERVEEGRLLNLLGSESWRTGRALSELVHLTTAAAAVVVYVGLMLALSWWLTLIALTAMGAMSLGVRRLTRRLDAVSQQATRANEGLAERMLEGLGAMKLIRLFNRQPHERARFTNSSRRVSRVFFRMGLLGGLVGPAYEVMAAALLVFVMAALFHGGHGLPTFLVFVFILYRLQPQVRRLEGARVALHSLSASVGAVAAFLDRSDKPVLASGTRPAAPPNEAVRFDAVSFRYAPDADWALRRLTLAFPAGATTALVGPSGAGKSTIVRLLLRLHDPSDGTVSVDGTPLPALDLAGWREQAAVVSQDVTLLNATVRDNIAYGRLDATDADIARAAGLADAASFVANLPQGYDTPVGSRGVRLSGGQKQRISLARAIVRNPALLVLDEATNALDSLSETAIQAALDALGADRTVVAVAHRLSTVEHADQIVVLDNGRVVESGSRDDLLARNGLFTRMYRLQHASALR
jgi:subfamily B ATP-binding cassette protein MsbA